MNTPRKSLLLGAAVFLSLGAFNMASALSVYYPGETQRGHGRDRVVIVKPAPVFEHPRSKVIIIKPERSRRHHVERIVVVKPAPVYSRLPHRSGHKTKVIIIEERHHPRFY